MIIIRMANRATLVARFQQVAVAAALALGNNVSFAQPGPSASEHFKRGLEFAQQGQFEAAAQEFKSAYDISPRSAVLFNLGQAYALGGKPVQAVETLKRYLSENQVKAGSARRTLVEELMMRSERRIGYLTISVAPPDAELFVDGLLHKLTTLDEPILLAVGEHNVLAVSSGYEPATGQVQIAANASRTLKLTLNRQAATLQAAAAQLEVTCAIPATLVQLDGGELRSSDDRKELALGMGQHEIRFERLGYERTVMHLAVKNPGIVRVDCDLHPTRTLPESLTGELMIESSEPGAEILVDGGRARPSTLLPIGPHLIEIRRTGFLPWSGRVELRARRRETIKIALRPTPEYDLEERVRERSRRRWTYVTGGAGVAVLGAALTTYVLNSQRYRQWGRDRDLTSSEVRAQRWSPTLDARVSDLQRQSASIQLVDDVAAGLCILGTGLLSYAVVSWFSSETR